MLTSIPTQFNPQSNNCKNSFFFSKELLFKRKLTNITRLLLIMLTSISFSQDVDHPWHFNIGMNALDIYPTNPNASQPLAPQGALFEEFFNVSDHWSIGGPTVSLSRLIKNDFSVGLRGSVGILKKIDENANVNFPYFSADLFLKKTFLSKKTISPFATLGFGYSSFDYDNSRALNLTSKNLSQTFSGGLGIDIRLSDIFGIDLQTVYKNPYQAKGVKHFIHQFGFYYAFGVKDTDGDGVYDVKDNCPDVPGLKEFAGCPDTDEDGIPDTEDNCPNLAGLLELEGCPDQDGDGIADNEDNCPDEPGTLENNGCPDSDEDGLIDSEDNCPNEKGAIDNDGCPWPDSDGDGITDNEDKCPEEVGAIENDGCPFLTEEVVCSINDLCKKIYFAHDSYKIQGELNFETLNKIRDLLDDYPKGIFVIEGHTSSDGSADYNQRLSENRAAAVANYLIENGIDKNRLESIGYGETKPVHENDTRSGRSKNRRVVFRPMN